MPRPRLGDTGASWYPPRGGHICAHATEDLKIGPFTPEHAGKMNFYLNVVDDTVRHETDNPSIGLILCRDKKTVLAEYTLRSVDKPIGISEYELTRALPATMESALPTIDEIETELAREDESTDGPSSPNDEG